MSNKTPRERDLFYTRCPVPTSLSIALETGLLDEEFADDGIRIRSLASSPAAAVRDAHYTHSHPRLIRHGGNIPPLMAHSRGHDLRVVGLSWTELTLPMLTTDGTGIGSPAQLKGKRLPLPRRGGVSLDCWEPAILRGYERTLETAGLDLDDVELVPIEVERSFSTTRFTSPGENAPLWDRDFILGLQREEILALLRGEVDAIFSESSVAVTVAAMFGLKKISDLRALPTPDAKATLPLPLTVSASGQLVEDDPFLIARWLAVMQRAAGRAAEHPDEAREILAAEISLPTDALDDALSPDAHLELGIGFRAGHLQALESQARFLFDHGFTDRMIDLDSIVDERPLQVASHLAFDQEPTREVVIPG